MPNLLIDPDGPDAIVLAHPRDWETATALVEALHRERDDLRISLRDATVLRPFHWTETCLVVLIHSRSLVRDRDQLEMLRRFLEPRIFRQRLFTVSVDRLKPLGWEMIGIDFDLTDWDERSQSAQVLDIESQIIIATDYVPEDVHALNIDPDEMSGPYAMTLPMLTLVRELDLTPAIHTLIANDNVIYVGDLVQKTAAEWLQVPGMSNRALLDIYDALVPLGLRLGLELLDWPPHDIEQVRDRLLASRAASELEQSEGGATFEPRDDRLAMVVAGDQDDRDAVLRPIVRQMHTMIGEKARAFADQARRLDNQPGWAGIALTASRLAELLGEAVDNVPDILGYFYPLALELGSFIEMDHGLSDTAASLTPPLEPEVRRGLVDLVHNLAPWLRSFPSIRQMDDEAGRFLTRPARLLSTTQIAEAAQRTRLISEEDALVFRQLADAIARGQVQGDKASQRITLSARNLSIAAISLLGSIYIGAVGSNVAVHSELAMRASAFVLEAEHSILEIAEPLPADIRHAILGVLRTSTTPSLPPPLSPAIPAPSPPPSLPLPGTAIRPREP